MGIVNGRSLSEVLTYSLADSLPLMGIVNKSKQVAVHAVVDSSLPLMGIVNPFQVENDGSQVPAHYPSWGS